MTLGRLRIGALASGAGSTLQAVIDACARGELAAEVAVVISNNSGSGALERARRHGIAALHVSAANRGGDAGADAAVRAALLEHSVQVVLLAGYMKKVGPATLAAFEGRIVNTHPALLPRHGGQGMYGSRVYEAVLAAGDAVTGVSVHLVDSSYDTGPVLAQREVPVEPGDDVASLTARVQRAEKALLVDVLRRRLWERGVSGSGFSRDS